MKKITFIILLCAFCFTNRLSAQWERHVLADYGYIFRGIAFPDDQDLIGYAAGEQYTYNGNGIILKTIDGGLNWTQIWSDTAHKGIEAMSFVNLTTGYVCGWNQYCAKTTDSGATWTSLNPGGTDPVYIYTSVDFIDANNGLVGAQLDDTAAIYVTDDGGATWTVASGVLDIPYRITHTANGTYYAISNGGRIQKSIDGGLTWTTIYNNGANLLVGINFYDNMTAIVTCETNLLKTTDGGATWTQSIVSPDTEGAIWRDVAWIAPNELVLVGTPDLIYESTDGGATWTWGNELLFNAEPALYDIAVTDSTIHVCGSQGNFYTKKIEDELGINNPGATHLSVYPNPIKDILNLNSAEAIISIAIYTASGQLVFSEKSDSIQKIDVSTFSSGVYFVKAATANGDRTIKVVKW
jgi:photosystem II stability/assembly factor-like uncharacterized protein